MGRFRDLTGERFGKLVVDSEINERAGNGSIVWRCKCDCENEINVRGYSLRSGNTKSCGCLSPLVAKEKMHIFLETDLIDGTALHAIRHNDKTRKNNKSGTRGVYWCNKQNKWYAEITLKKKTYYLGRFEKLSDATEARLLAEEQYFAPILEACGETLIP